MREMNRRPIDSVKIKGTVKPIDVTPRMASFLETPKTVLLKQSVLLLCMLCAFCICCLCADEAIGQAGGQKGIPDYKFEIDTIESDPADSYSTMFLTLTSLKKIPSKSDERFEIVVSFLNYYTSQETSVSATIWLKAGQSKGTCRIAFPMIGQNFVQMASNNSRSRNLFYGRSSAERVISWSVSKSGGGETQNWSGNYEFDVANLRSSGLIYVTNDVQSRKHSWFMDSDGDSISRKTPPNCVPSGNPVPAFDSDPLLGEQGDLIRKVLSSANASIFGHVTLDAVSGICMPVDKLPELLSEFGQTKLFLIEHSDWTRLQTSYPDKLATLLKWVENGGSLTILKAGEYVAKPEYVFAKTSNMDSDSWTLRDSEGKSISTDSPTNKKVAFSERRYYGGKVSLVKGDMSRFAAKDWDMVRNSRPAISIQNDSLGETLPGFKIPGIGEPPIVLFLFLIVIFVVLIGPVNYILLRKQKRLSLLLITVPTLSILVCTSLYLYVWIQEGFGLNTRIRSISYMDQTTGRFVCLSRHQCLGAKIPTNGYQFDKTDWVSVSDSEYQQLVIQDLGDSISFKGGDIRPRIEHQVIRKSYGSTPSRIVIADDGQGNYTAVNNFSESIKWLVVSKDKRRLVAKSVPPGQTVSLTDVDASDRQAIRQMWMTMEKDVETFSKQTYYSDDPDSKIENRIGSVLNEVGIIKNDSYVAIFDGHFELSPPVAEKVTLRRGFHVLVGRLK